MMRYTLLAVLAAFSALLFNTQPASAATTANVVDTNAASWTSSLFVVRAAPNAADSTETARLCALIRAMIADTQNVHVFDDPRYHKTDDMGSLSYLMQLELSGGGHRHSLGARRYRVWLNAKPASSKDSVSVVHQLRIWTRNDDSSFIGTDNGTEPHFDIRGRILTGGFWVMSSAGIHIVNIPAGSYNTTEHIRYNPYKKAEDLPEIARNFVSETLEELYGMYRIK
ncbi:MAG: hypothetical protein Q8P78_00990 [bacterium]|nr:hypothetical protein [bacterium]